YRARRVARGRRSRGRSPVSPARESVAVRDRRRRVPAVQRPRARVRLHHPGAARRRHLHRRPHRADPPPRLGRATSPPPAKPAAQVHPVVETTTHRTCDPRKSWPAISPNPTRLSVGTSSRADSSLHRRYTNVATIGGSTNTMMRNVHSTLFTERWKFDAI